MRVKGEGEGEGEGGEGQGEGEGESLDCSLHLAPHHRRGPRCLPPRVPAQSQPHL